MLLLGFAFLAGAGTALSPCILPVLPIVLSAGTTGGTWRPLGIVIGKVLSFTFTMVALVYVIEALGLPDDIVRTAAIAVLLIFGLSLVVPWASARLEGWLSRFSTGPRAVRGEGFFSGLVLGASLGFVYAPCAGPVLAAIATVSASQPFTGGKLAVAFSYAVGSGLMLYALILGGRRVIRRLSSYAGRIQQAMGGLMVAVAVGMFANLDTEFRTAVANNLPSFVYNPTKGLEGTGVVKRDLASVRGEKTKEARGGLEAKRGAGLPVLGGAPDFTGNQRWFNTPGGRPLTLEGLRGRVVLVDFWTYTCINCIRTFPYLRAWDRRYRAKGLTIVGIHTPEFAFEKKASNVARAIRVNSLRYPVAQDNDYATWNAYGNQFWPAKYLIDARGRVRYTHFGEGEYDTTEKAIRSLLAEAGRSRLGGLTETRGERASPGVTTPETYLGALRAERYVNGVIDIGTRTFRASPGELPADHFAYRGRWRVDEESATAVRRARLDASFGARRVFLVLSSPRRSRRLRVLLDGKPIPDRLAGRDVRGGVARIGAQRLYRLVELPRAGRHSLRLEFEPGVSGFAFTFG